MPAFFAPRLGVRAASGEQAAVDRHRGAGDVPCRKTRQIDAAVNQ